MFVPDFLIGEGEAVFGDLCEGSSGASVEEGFDAFLPDIACVSCGLFWLDEFGFHGPVGPPLVAVSVCVHGFGEELVACLCEQLELYPSAHAGLDGPEASAARGVLQILALVCGADEHALARLVDFHA